MSQYERIQTDDPTLNRVQDATDLGIRNAFSGTIAEGKILEVTVSATADTQVKHNLGRAFIGVLLVEAPVSMEVPGVVRIGDGTAGFTLKPAVQDGVFGSGTVKIKLWVF